MIKLRRHVEDALDSIDAAVFTGDGIYSPDAIERFRWFLRRWDKEMAKRESVPCQWTPIEEGSSTYNTCQEGEEFTLADGMELWPRCHWCGRRIEVSALAQGESLP